MQPWVNTNDGSFIVKSTEVFSTAALPISDAQKRTLPLGKKQMVQTTRENTTLQKKEDKYMKEKAKNMTRMLRGKQNPSVLTKYIGYRLF